MTVTLPRENTGARGTTKRVLQRTAKDSRRVFPRPGYHVLDGTGRESDGMALKLQINVGCSCHVVM